MSRPDWKFWKTMRLAKDWQAAALSLGIDPDSMKHHPQAWMAGSKPVFSSSSFRDSDEKMQFDVRYRLVDAYVREREDRVRHHNTGEIDWLGFVMWLSKNAFDVPSDVKDVTTKFAPDHEDGKTNSDSSNDEDKNLSELFDGVGTEQLEKMFPSGNWQALAERASRNGLGAARTGTAKFNPYLAAKWWLDKQNPKGWDLARCMRVLANNLPARSGDSRHLLTGELD
jgi:hypothetical protein